MSKSTYPLKLPASIKKAAAELAASDGVSLMLIAARKGTTWHRYGVPGEIAEAEGSEPGDRGFVYQHRDIAPQIPCAKLPRSAPAGEIEGSLGPARAS